jgi:putative transposase
MPDRQVISLDPGVRSFLTFYDGESYGEIGKNISIKLKRLSKSMDKLDKKIDEEKRFYKKCRLKRAKSQIQEKKKNIVDDLHKKTCNFLKHYRYVLLPVFKVKGMIKSLPKAVKRSMLDLSHFKFKMRLIQKTSETGSKILICNEIMTSKTCTKCGKINGELGKSKIFTCPSCKISIDRDFNGARNILLRALRGSSTFLP